MVAGQTGLTGLTAASPATMEHSPVNVLVQTPPLSLVGVTVMERVWRSKSVSQDTVQVSACNHSPQDELCVPVPYVVQLRLGTEVAPPFA